MTKFEEYDYLQNLFTRFSNAPKAKQMETVYPQVQQIIITIRQAKQLSKFLKSQTKKDKESVDNLFKKIINQDDSWQNLDKKKK